MSFVLQFIVMVFLLSEYQTPDNQGKTTAEFEQLYQEFNLQMNQNQFSLADSLLQQLEKVACQTDDANLQLRALNERTYFYLVTRRPDLGLAHFEAFPPHILANADDREKLILFGRKASLFAEVGQFEQAITLTDSLLYLAEQNPAFSDRKLALLNIRASALQRLYRISEAIDDYQKAYQAGLEADIPEEQLAIILNNLAIVLNTQKRFDEALEILKEAHAINKQSQNVLGVIQNLNNIANALVGLGHIDAAVDSLQSAIRINRDGGNLSSVVRNYYNAGKAMESGARYEEAYPFYRKGYALSKEIDLKMGLMYHASGLASYYWNHHKFDDSERYARESLTYASEFSELGIEVQMLELLSQIKERRGELAQALQLLRLYQVRYDSLTELSNQRAIEEVRSQFRFDLMMAENELLRQELAFSSERRAALRRSLFTAVVVLSIFLGLLLVLRRQKKVIQQKNQHLNDLQRHRESLLNILVHDLRDPLSAMISSIEILREELSGGDENISHILTIADRNNQRMLRIVDEILTVNKISTEAISTEFSRVNITQLSQEVVLDYHSMASKKDMTIRFEADDIVAVTHAKYISQLLRHLLSNAIKFSYPQSRITVNVRQQSRDYWQLIVQDEGQGFSDDDKSRAFQMFQQLSAKPTGNERSTGLGLYTVSMITNKLHGDIRLESTKGAGATFVCTFPMDGKAFAEDGNKAGSRNFVKSKSAERRERDLAES